MMSMSVVWEVGREASNLSSIDDGYNPPMSLYRQSLANRANAEGGGQ
jgi:hypothetical protein